MTDPNTLTTPTNPQDLIDQALGGGATATAPTPTPPTEPTLPTPEPLTPPAATEQMVEQKAEEVVAPKVESVPEELTSTQPEPIVMPEPPKETKPMGEDMPLAFAATAPADTTTTTPPEPYIEPVNTAAVVPPILAAPAVDQTSTPKKKKGLKIVGLVVGFFVMFGVVGAVSYQMLTGQSLIAAVFEPKWTRVDGVVVKNPAYEKLTGDAKIINDDARDEYLGRGDYAPDPKIEAANYKGACEAIEGAQWCDYGFCMKNNGSQGNCNNRAVELGYTVTYGASVLGVGKCNEKDIAEGGKDCTCGRGTGAKAMCFSRGGVCDADDAGPDVVSAEYYNGQGLCATAGTIKSNGDYELKDTAGLTFSCNDNGCSASGSCYVSRSTCTETSSDSCLKGSSKYIEGSEKNGTNLTFEGKCGTVEQIDVNCGGRYIQSRTRLNGECQEGEEKTTTVTTPTPSPSPSPSGSVSLMCTGLTRTPTTTPKIGDKLTFTCAGSSTPAGAVSLNYKFRYNINSGAYVTLANKTATTAEMTVAACGTYKVQCQTCGTINGVLTCDPVWGSATVQ